MPKITELPLLAPEAISGGEPVPVVKDGVLYQIPIDVLLSIYPSLEVTGSTLTWTDPDGFKWPLNTAPPPTDIFPVLGQSNGEGRAVAGAATPSTKAYLLAGGAISYPLADPVGGALNKSMWPAFVNEWTAQTGRRAAIIEQATGGSALLAAANPGNNWSPTGTLRAAAVDAINQHLALFDPDGPLSDHVKGKVRPIIVQGEAEAEAINGTTITGPLYKQALKDLADYLDANVVGGIEEMLVIRTGARNERSNAAGWAEIRAAQDQACAEHPKLRMVYRGAHSFSLGGQSLMEDAVHWNVGGLNRAGRASARAAATLVDNVPAPAAPVLLGTHVITDTSNAAATSASAEVTTSVGTRSLIVSVAAARPTSIGTNAINPPVFAGIALTRVNGPVSPGTTAAANTSTPGRVDAALFMLSEDAFGGSLDGVTGTLAISTTASSNILSAVAGFVDSDVLPDVTAQALVTGAGASGTALTATFTTGASVLALATAVSAADSAGALTWSFAGLAEIVGSDGGASSGSRSGQAAAATGQLGEVTGTTVTATCSGTFTSGALLIGCFRKKVDGE